MSVSATPTMEQVATNVDVTTVGNEEVIDFDVPANDDYEIQSCVMVNDDDDVVEAAVRFGRVEERPDLAIGVGILESAWLSAVQDATGIDALGESALEADMSDFQHTVPHLRVVREDVEAFGCETLTIEEFAVAVAELAAFTGDVLRADDDTIDAEIDAYL